MPIDRDLVLRVVELARRAGVRELELRHEGCSVRVVRAPAAAQSALAPVTEEAAEAPPAPDGLAIIRSEKVALFHRGRAPGERPLVEVGSEVRQGQVVATLEALRKLADVVAPADGVVLDVLAKDGQPVEYGEGLIALGTRA